MQSQNRILERPISFRHSTHPRPLFPCSLPFALVAKPSQPCALSSPRIARTCAYIHAVTSLCRMQAS
uniref:Uncharacterized protein n=1 Tax=Physcomitrium patens TaxID=3218 RepID=A0A7I4B9C1_PHYPA